MMSISTLYLCYFGLREPLVQTQVLPYLRRLAASGVEVSLLTFEPELKRRWTADELEEERSKLAREGIRWHRLTYHKRPSLPATAFDILAGALFAARMARLFRAVRARKKGAFFRVLTTSDAEEASARLRGAGLSEEDFGVEAVRAGDVPRFLRRARLGVSFRKATFSQIAASPTKIPEY